MMGPIQQCQRVKRLLKFGLLVSGLRPARQFEADADWRMSSRSGPVSLRWDEAHGAPRPPDSLLFAGLISSYVPQENEHACSVACMAMLINSLHARQYRSAGNDPVTQSLLLDKVGSATWKSAVGPEGDGVTLDELAGLVGLTLGTFGIKRFDVDVIHVNRVASAARSKTRQVLTAASRSANHFLLANFLQGVYTGNPAGDGHYAPVAGYDAARRRVFILDPDRHSYGPYWISEERFLEGMATRDDSIDKSRGYVSIRIQ